ncbi:MAG: hypothetical protein R3B96_09760 [Pirellulaceae bacterium]|nr:hypothetical protein [Planctomycetales bacterium]
MGTPPGSPPREKRRIAFSLAVVLAIATLAIGTRTCLAFWQVSGMRPLTAFEPTRPDDTRMGLANVLGARLHAGIAELQRRDIERKWGAAWRWLSGGLLAALMSTLAFWYAWLPTAKENEDEHSVPADSCEDHSLIDSHA